MRHFGLVLIVVALVVGCQTTRPQNYPTYDQVENLVDWRVREEGNRLRVSICNLNGILAKTQEKVRSLDSSKALATVEELKRQVTTLRLKVSLLEDRLGKVEGSLSRLDDKERRMLLAYIRLTRTVRSSRTGVDDPPPSTRTVSRKLRPTTEEIRKAAEGTLESTRLVEAIMQYLERLAEENPR